MHIRLRHLSGLAGLPKDRTALSTWARRNAVPVHILHGNGGVFETVSLFDLPEHVRTAYQLRLVEDAGLSAGSQDDEAHLSLEAKPIYIQQVAHQRVAIVAFVHKHKAAGMNWPQIMAQFAGADFGKCPTNRPLNGGLNGLTGLTRRIGQRHRT